jgi:UDP-3-O-[3-hydroxymyristoyl] glucosamine N-acyltransferase
MSNKLMKGASRTIAELAEHVGGRVTGDGSIEINAIGSLDDAGPGEIAYLEDDKFFDLAQASPASCVIVPEGTKLSSRNAIEVKHPKLAFALIAKLLYPPKAVEPSIHSSAVIANTADIDLTVFIGPNVCVGDRAKIGAGSRVEAGVVIGENVTIGKDCVLHPNVTIYDGVMLGDRVILHAGACLGADGFGYVRDDMGYHKFPQIGTVVIEDDVEIGAHTCIDRAALGRTRIGRGTKLDNMVHVGHNCDIGERVVIAAQTGISGSVTIEHDCVIGGQVGFGDHIRVQSGAVIGSKAGVLPGKIVRPGVWWGIPIQPLDEYKRLNAHVNRLPQMREELKELRARLEELEKKAVRED